jgi:hypothetical protein
MKRRDHAIEDGQKRFKEKRWVEVSGVEAAIWRRESAAPTENWHTVRKSGAAAAVRNSCFVMIVAATLHTYLSVSTSSGAAAAAAAAAAAVGVGGGGGRPNADVQSAA